MATRFTIPHSHAAYGLCCIPSIIVSEKNILFVLLFAVADIVPDVIVPDVVIVVGVVSSLSRFEVNIKYVS